MLDGRSSLLFDGNVLRSGDSALLFDGVRNLDVVLSLRGLSDRSSGCCRKSGLVGGFSLRRSGGSDGSVLSGYFLSDWTMVVTTSTYTSRLKKRHES